MGKTQWKFEIHSLHLCMQDSVTYLRMEQLADDVTEADEGMAPQITDKEYSNM